MQKIPSLFVRDYEHPNEEARTKKGRFLATEQVTPGCEWALNGEGLATRKRDGTAVRISYDTDKPLFSKRYDAKQGKVPPPGFEPCQDPDPVTGHWPGWVPVSLSDPADKYLIEAYNNHDGEALKGGTYEAIGPKINGNKERISDHKLIPHGEESVMGYYNFTDPFKEIKEFLEYLPHIEGIVFHHPDGRMCKVKRSDFGLPW